MFSVGRGRYGMRATKNGFKVKVAIGGPDLNPTVFIGGFITIIGKELANDVGLTYPAKRRLFDASDSAYETIWGDDRRLGSSSSTAEFCVGEHLLANVVWGSMKSISNA